MSRKLPQIAAGAGAGWVTGYVTMKVSKTMPTILLFYGFLWKWCQWCRIKSSISYCTNRSLSSGRKDGGDGGGWEPAPPADRPPQGVHQGRLEQGQETIKPIYLMDSKLRNTWPHSKPLPNFRWVETPLQWLTASRTSSRCAAGRVARWWKWAWSKLQIHRGDTYQIS